MTRQNTNEKVGQHTTAVTVAQLPFNHYFSKKLFKNELHTALLCHLSEKMGYGDSKIQGS